MRKWLLLACLAGVVTATAMPAAAQTAGTDAAAEVLFQEAQQLFAAGKAEQACPKFEASYRLDSGLGTLLNLARCYEAVGRTASAWVAYVDLASLARRAEQADRAAIATERAAAIEPTLTRIAVELDGALVGQEVAVDGKPMLPALYGTAVPVDPGEHLVEARASGYQPWSKTVATAGEGQTVTLQIPALVSDPSVPKPLPKGEPPPPLPVPVASAGSFPTLMVAGGITAGSGLVLLAVSGGLAAEAASAWSDAGCSNGLCATPAAQSLSEQANSSADAATGLVIAGGIVATAGVVMFILGALDSPTPQDDGDAGVSLTPNGLRVRF